MLKFSDIKSENRTISPRFLKYLSEKFKLNTFVETGTYLAETTEAAKDFFDKIHSIELSKELYDKAQQKLHKFDKIKLYQGDSTFILPKILQNESDSILFWLDGHYSEGVTAKGNKSTPIIEELEAIKNSDLDNYIIMIDDIRIFQEYREGNPESLKDYPNANYLKEVANSLNAEFCIYGDIALIFVTNITPKISRILKAVTNSRLRNYLNLNDFDDEELKIIANAQGKEKNALLDLHRNYNSTEKYGLGKHYRLWSGLIKSRNADFNGADNDFDIAEKLGVNKEIIKFLKSKNSIDKFNFYKNITFIESLPEDSLYFDDRNKVKSPDDLLKNMLGQEIFHQAKYIIFAGVHQFQEKDIIEKIFPNIRKCILLEPIPEIANQLQSDIKDDSRYIVVNAALSNKDGISEFHLTNNEAMSSSLLELGRHTSLFPYVQETGTINVQTVTFDSLIENYNLPHCDALILDVQGSEYDIIANISDIQLEKIKFIYTEVSKYPIYKNSHSKSDLELLINDFFIFAGYAPNTNEVKEHGNSLYLNKVLFQQEKEKYPIFTTMAPKVIDKQKKSINSWLDAGFEVYSINTQKEIEILEAYINNINFINNESTAIESTGRDLIYLDTIIDSAKKLKINKFGIINSDIILKNINTAIIKEIFELTEEGLVYSSREDIENESDSEGKQYVYGFDLFFLNLDFIEELPKSEFAIGLPWWDYWLPSFCIANRIPLFKLADKFAFHIIHQINYSEELWIKYAKHYAKYIFPVFFKKFEELEQPNFFIEDSRKAAYDLAQDLSAAALNLIEQKSKPISIRIDLEKDKQQQIGDHEIESLKFSVITPSYNQAEYIEETIKSVLNQNYRNFEHIVMDGGSSDGTLEILKKYQHLSWTSETDSGQSNAINKALKLAVGDIIAWINSDDYYKEGAFHSVANFFENNPEANVLIGDCEFIHQDGSHKLIVKNNELEFEDIIKYWDKWVPPTQPSIFFRRVLLEEVGLLDESLNYAMDYDLWLRVAKQHKFYYINKALAAYRFHSDSKSGSGDDWSAFFPEWHKVYLRYRENSSLLPPSPVLTVAIIIPKSKSSSAVFMSELSELISLIQNQIFQDIELLILYHQREEPIIKLHNENIQFTKLEITNQNKDNIIRQIVENSKGDFLHLAEVGEIYHERLYAESISMLLKNPSKSGIKFQNMHKSVNSIFNKNDLLNSGLIIRKEHLLQKIDLNIDISVNEDDLEYEFKITVIIPTYNRKEVLAKCLHALEAQSLPKDKFEVIVIDDGSSDGTNQLVENYKAKFKLSYIYQNNSGPAAARNKGITSAKGKILLIINDDTIADKNLLESHLNLHHELKGKKLAVLGTFDYTNSAREKPFVEYLHHKPLVFAYPAMQSGRIYPYRFFWTCNVSIQKQAFEEAGLFDEDFKEPMAEDTEMGYRLEKAGWQVLYHHSAKSYHDHWLTPDGFAKRQKMSGRNMVKVFKKHPELLKKESKLFGFSDLGETTQNNFRKFIERNLEISNKSLEILNKLNELDISNPDRITIKGNLNITKTDLFNLIDKHIWNIHYLNFFEGILEEIQNNQVKESDSEIEDNSKAVVPISNEVQKVLICMFGWNESGGGTIFPRTVAKRLAKRGKEVVVFYAGLNHPIESKLYYLDKSEEDGITLYGLFNRKAPFLMQEYPDLEVNDPKVVEIFQTILDEELPDVVHFYNFLGFSFEIAATAKQKGIPTVFTPQNYHLIDPALYMINSNLETWQDTNAFNNNEFIRSNPHLSSKYELRSEKARELINNIIDRTIAISKRVKEILVDFGCDHNKIDVIYQVPESTENLSKKILNKDNEILKIGFIGTLIPQKGVHKLVSALQLLDNKKFRAEIYGEGNEIYIRELKKIDRKSLCSFHGKYSSEQLNEIAQNIEIIVIPSIWEECAGLVIMESLAMGIPVLVARIGGMPEFIKEEVNGFSYPHNSERNLAALLEKIQNNHSLRRRLRNSSVLDRTFDDYIDDVSNLYSYLIKK